MTKPAVARRPVVSVVVCTYTRARWAGCAAAVDSVLGQLREGDECLLVTDHNEPLRWHARQWFTDCAAVQVVSNGQAPGLSGARNTGVAHSHGEIVAFLDDDAVATPTWLEECLAPFTEPEVLAVGAAALPCWPAGRRPGWFPPEFDWVVGCTHRGLPDRRAAVRNVIGAAMAFRREAFAVAGTFDVSVGRVGTVPVGCEETELCIRIRQAKPTAQIIYQPGAVVHHRITPERTRIGYFVRRCFGEGRSKARVARLVGPGDGLSSERDYLRRVLPRAVLRELSAAARGHGAGLGAATLIAAGVTAAGLGFLREAAVPRPSVPSWAGAERA
ncbi:glycosyltransferase family 2 protein [Actinoplanes sp. NPDC049681]|uniref:glycosyltransferase family 2 protein n=1 Tax=Actinoplanes sp. NPDC049681 TaxID=3363905 RepID=UPI0037ACA19F